MTKIIADSTCDLSKELIEEYDIRIIPLHILLGEEEYEDGYNITPEKIYEWSHTNKTVPKTSAPSMEKAMAVIENAIAQGDDAVCFAISESMSTSANIMRLAVNELQAGEKVYVIDSANLSTGTGHVEVVIMMQYCGKRGK